MARSRGAPRRVDSDATRRSFSFKFIGEVVSELRRVVWPTREETTRLTIMVLAVAAAVALVYGGYWSLLAAQVRTGVAQWFAARTLPGLQAGH